MDKTTLLNISKNMQDLTFVLANKNYDKLGALSNVDQNTVVYNKTMHGMELSFDVYKELDGVQEKLWYELTDFKLVWVKEINEYFQITVSTDELSYTKKTVTATSLCEAELSQVYLYNIEINTEDDIARDDYKVTTFYNMDDPEASLIHRILSKVPQYTIKHIDSSLSKIQRSFSIDGTSILDFLNGECSEQFNCLFTFDSTDRSVSVYDLYTVCEECDERDDMSNFIHIDENGSLKYTCPKCGSHNVKYYGEDTKIFVDNENLTDEVRLETDTDSVKNCFKLVAGDDLMTATVRLLNMNGSDYIYYVSDDQKKDMPKELVDRIESYDELCASYNTEYESLVSQIYEASSKLYYYKNTMMPTIEQSTVTAATEAAKLTTQNLSPLGLSSVSTSTSKSTVESALKNYAKVYVKSGYVKLEVNDSNYTYVGTDSAGNHYGTWTGNFKVTNYSDETDIAYSSTITVKVYDNYQDFIEQKVKKTILSDADDDDSIFDVLSIDNLDNFKEALTYYCLNRLKSFHDATQSAIDVLVQMNQGVQDAVTYSSLYVPYYNKLQACQAEIDKRQVTVDEWQAKYDSAVSRQQEIQKILNFEDYIGADLYKLFCCYRREDTYQNDNYISDGLEDQEVIERAKEFLEVAKKELMKSATMQHSISTTLYNLLLIPEFKLILNSFEVGNWIRVRVDGNVYKLRLIQYEISFSNMNTISVEFSDVTKIRDSLTDFQSLVKDTQSISSSYSYISKQADAGHKASVNMDKIVEDGLNSALVNIKNNDREEIIYDKHGILCREYDDISDDYSDEQLLITHNILAFTDDNWKSSSLGLGKHEFIRYDGNAFVKDDGYGLSSKFVTAGYIYGSQIISGDIYSFNYSPSVGTHIDLKEGSFSFAGGKFAYNPKKDKMTMRGVTIEWSTSTPPEMADIDGLTEQLKGIDEYLDQLDDRIQSFSQTNDPSSDWTTIELKNKHKGDLWFNPSNGLTKRWTGTAWETITDSGLETLAKSKAQIFTTTPTTPYYVGDLWVQGSNGDILNCITTRTSGNYVESDWVKSSKYTDDTALTNFMNGEYKNTISDLQLQADKKAETWYQATDPSTNWSTSDLKLEHKGDLWYNTSDENTYIYNGSSWDKTKTDPPQSVFDTIDGKAQIFISQPAPPYSVGDLWFNGSSEDIMTCIYSRSSGTYVSSDWQKRNKYTDMTSVENKGYQNASQVTTITENTIKTTNLVAQNLHVNSANIDGLITASQINTSGLIAENISATTISGKTIIGGSISSGTTISGVTITGSSGYFTEGFHVETSDYGRSNIFDIDSYGIGLIVSNPANDKRTELILNSGGSKEFGSIEINSNGGLGKINFVCDPNYGLLLNGNPFIPEITTDINPKYETSSYGNEDLIKFKDVTNKPKMGATPQYVMSYVADQLSDYPKKDYNGSISVYDCQVSHTLYCPGYSSLHTTSNVAGFNGYGYLCPNTGSSQRFKHNIRPLQTYDADKLYEMDIDEFIYNDDYIDNSDEWYQKIIPGFIAEKLDKLLPIVVSHDENGIPNGWKEKAIIPLMLKLIQEQHIKIESLIQQNISLEGRIAILDQMVNQLISQLNQNNN